MDIGEYSPIGSMITRFRNSQFWGNLRGVGLFQVVIQCINISPPPLVIALSVVPMELLTPHKMVEIRPRHGDKGIGPATSCDAAHLRLGVKSPCFAGKSLAMLCDVNSNMSNNLLPILEYLSHLLSNF